MKRRDLEKKLSECGWRFLRSGGSHDIWTDGTREEPVHVLIKVETHNHPTAISPYPGASTGAGGVKLSMLVTTRCP